LSIGHLDIPQSDRPRRLRDRPDRLVRQAVLFRV